MDKIKVIKGLPSWEVMKRASEGEPWAHLCDGEWIKADGGCSDVRIAGYISILKDVAIIDTTTPEIDWDKFDWDFFNQYGGLQLMFDGRVKGCAELPLANDIVLLESPFYPWLGGEQPVPDNVEVEVIYRDMKGNNIDCAACHDWATTGYSMDDIIAFRLTGRVL